MINLRVTLGEVMLSVPSEGWRNVVWDQWLGCGLVGLSWGFLDDGVFKLHSWRWGGGGITFKLQGEPVSICKRFPMVVYPDLVRVRNIYNVVGAAIAGS